MRVLIPKNMDYGTYLKEAPDFTSILKPSNSETMTLQLKSFPRAHRDTLYDLAAIHGVRAHLMLSAIMHHYLETRPTDALLLEAFRLSKQTGQPL